MQGVLKKLVAALAKRIKNAEVRRALLDGEKVYALEIDPHVVVVFRR